jgi:hypothetical protein
MADTQSNLWEDEKDAALLSVLFSLPEPEVNPNQDAAEIDTCSGSSSSPS